MADNKKSPLEQREETIQDLQKLDQNIQSLLKSSVKSLNGTDRKEELNQLHSDFTELVRHDTYNFVKTKGNSQSSYSYLTNAIFGKANPIAKQAGVSAGKLSDKGKAISDRINMENLFNNGDMQASAMFLDQASDIFHICDEIESICAYLYQLDEAVLVLRDNVMNSEQVMADLPFDITFSAPNDTELEYRKIATDVWKESGMLQKVNDHVVPNGIRFGRYYVINTPYSEIGLKMFANKVNMTRNLFDFGGGPVGYGESVDAKPSEAYTSCMESVDQLLESIYPKDDKEFKIPKLGTKDRLREIIESNMKNILINEEDTPPNITPIQESAFQNMTGDLQKLVEKALKETSKKFDIHEPKKPKKDDQHFSDATFDLDTIDNIAGSYKKLVDPRQIVPIKIFDHVIGYYYLENYDYSRRGTTITDILQNRMNFNDQNMIVDQMVSGVLRNLKYGDVLQGNNDFKSMILNCLLYAERRTNPIRIKFIPAEYVIEFKTNCDTEGNGQPVLLKSLVYGRLYVSLLMFMITTIITKSTDTEFYYLREGLLSQSYEDQVSDIIDQFRKSNVDISSIVNGNLMEGNRAINKRYFMCTGTQDIKPFDVEVVSGQNVDIHNDLLTDLKKMAIGATGVPSVAVDYMDEVEFATILKMTNTRTLTRSNNIQTDFNPSLTELTIKMIKADRPNAIPPEVLETCECKLRPCNTINNNISSDEMNNAQATIDSMIETYYKGQNTESYPSLDYEKEEMRKRLIMMVTKSLPWGYMDSIKDEVKLEAKRQQELDKIMKAKDEADSSGAEA